MRTAAQFIWPHLRQGTPEPVQQRTPTVSDAMWPSLSREAKAQEHDQQLRDQILKKQRDDFVQRQREARERGSR
jgi:hypothetical protein